MIDDELVITVRVRVPVDLDHTAKANLAGAVVASTSNALNDNIGSLAGVEIGFPTYEAYDQPRGTTTP